MDKYYTPELNEFCLDFEYEEKLNGVYEKKVFDGYTALIKKSFCGDYGDWYDSIEEDIESDRIRIKYLDKEDIESLGFILKREFNCFMKINTYSVDCFIYLNPWYTQIKVGRDITKTEQVFEGRIKNKSELQQILKMVL